MLYLVSNSQTHNQRPLMLTVNGSSNQMMILNRKVSYIGVKKYIIMVDNEFKWFVTQIFVSKTKKRNSTEPLVPKEKDAKKLLPMI